MLNKEIRWGMGCLPKIFWDNLHSAHFYQLLSILHEASTHSNFFTRQTNKELIIDKLKLTGQNLGRVFNSRLGHACICRAITWITKRPNLKLKTRLKQLLVSLPLAYELPKLIYWPNHSWETHLYHQEVEGIYSHFL